MGNSGCVSIVERTVHIPSICARYPEVAGMEDETVQGKINELIQGKVYKLIKRQMFKTGQEKKVWSDFAVKTNGLDILSILFKVYSNPGNCHRPTVALDSANVHLVTGKEIGLKSIFSDEPEYIEKINYNIFSVSRLKGISLPKSFKGINRKRQKFYLEPGFLVLYFPLYKGVKYKNGVMELSIPLPLLADIISKKSPVAKLL